MLKFTYRVRDVFDYFYMIFRTEIDEAFVKVEYNFEFYAVC